MGEILTPDTSEALRDAVETAVARRQAVRVRGGGSQPLDAVADTPVTLDLSRLRGIVDYDPDELVITARAGTPVAEVEAALAQRQQMLAFSPVDPARVLGGAGGRATLGGLVSTGWAGPRRVTAGAVRDHVLGFTGVSGKGDAFKAGGRVVKNVTGFDLPKLFTGAWGTLGVLDTVTLRLYPSPRFEATLCVRADAAKAGHVMSLALNNKSVVSCAAHTRDGVWLRMEGFRPSVEVRLDRLRADLAEFGAMDRIDGAASAALWDRVAIAADVPADAALWRLSLPAASGSRVLARVRDVATGWVQDWGGARLWLGVADAGDAHAGLVREAAARAAGTARLLRASPEVRVRVARETADPALKALGGRVKAAFDPYNLFNPGLDLYEL